MPCVHQNLNAPWHISLFVELYWKDEQHSSRRLFYGGGVISKCPRCVQVGTNLVSMTWPAQKSGGRCAVSSVLLSTVMEPGKQTVMIL